MITVACVLRSGGEYNLSHLLALHDGVRRHLGVPHRFLALTDLPQDVESAGVEAIPLRHNWPGWWSKLELFRPSVFEIGPVFYVDLDTVFCSQIDDLVCDHRFTALQNFWSNDPKRIGSGLLAWNCDLSVIYRKFAAAPERAMREYCTTQKWGDQGFIFYNTPIVPERWQTRFPGAVRSYKRDNVARSGIPSGTRVLCFHGKPRPWAVPNLWERYVKGEPLI